MTNRTKSLLIAGAACAFLGIATSHNLIRESLAAEHGPEEAHGDADHKEEGRSDEHGHGDEHGHVEEGAIDLTEAQIEAAGIKIGPVSSGTLARQVTVPGKIVAAADRVAQIVPKVGGTVTEAHKNLGDTVAKGEVLALIESREMAEAFAEHQAAQRAEELTRIVFAREKDLWDRKITAEQDYLNARNAHQEARIRLDLTRQKLQALGHDVNESGSRFHELKSPLAGRVITRELTLGEYVDATHAAYTVADLSVVWVETAIAPTDLPFVKEGQAATVTNGADKADGKLTFVSPAIDPETRTAKAIIELDNRDGKWRPGGFANASIVTLKQDAGLIVPKDALQSIENQTVLFVRTDHGFEKRTVTTGREANGRVEILSGLVAGDQVAITNSFTLKAEIGKSEAAHEH